MELKKSLFNKVAANQVNNFTKIRLQHMFACEICEIFKNTYSEERPPTDASINKRQQETHALSGKKNESRILFSKAIANAISASRKLQFLEFDSIT